MTPLPVPIQLSCYTNNPLGMLQECVFPQMVGAFGGPGLFGLILGGTIISGLWLARPSGITEWGVATVIALQWGRMVLASARDRDGGGV